jgi:hypothetical protein
MYARTLRAGIVTGVIGVLAVVSVNHVQMIAMGAGNQAFMTIFAAAYQLAVSGCLPFSAALVAASLVMRHVDAAAGRLPQEPAGDGGPE